MNIRSLHPVIIALLTLSPPGIARALDTMVTLTADDTIRATTSELVTFGLPLAEGDVSDISQINVSIDGVEQPIAVEPGLSWHWKDGSLRSVTIQLPAVDMTEGDVVLSITDAGNNAGTLEMQDHSGGWSSGPDNKANLPFPRLFALHDLDYLASTGLIPPYLPGDTRSGAGRLKSDQFDNEYGELDFSVDGSGAQASYLFDRATAMLKAYMTTGDVKFLKEGFLSKQHYYAHVRNDGSSPAPGGGSGCWTFGSVACADGKYIYTEPAKLAWALFGDNSQWDDELIINMAVQADIGWNQHASSDPYNAENEGFTERGAGISGLAEINAFEITGDQAVLATMNARLNSLRDMQQVEQPWDTANGWLPKSGAFTHSWGAHEGMGFPGEGNDDDRRFSPWMSENIADFLWQVYHVFAPENEVLSLPPEEIGEMLRLLGNAIDLYGFTSSYVGGQGLDADYETKTGMETIYISCAARNNEAVSLLYSGSAYASAAALQHTAMNDGGYADQHNVEVLLPLAAALYFESDTSNQERLMARMAHIERQWFNNNPKDCSTIFHPLVYRLFNWQHRSNSAATMSWVLQNLDGR